MIASLTTDNVLKLKIKKKKKREEFFLLRLRKKIIEMFRIEA